MDWSVTLVNSLGALITGAGASTTIKIRRIADDYLYDWNDGTFKAAGHTTPSTPLVEVSASLFPGLYKKTVAEATWNDGDYQGVIRYAPVGGTATNVDMMARVRDGKEIDIRIGDVVEALPSATDIDTQLSGTHGSGAWDGVATPLTAQQTRDAMKLTPSIGVPGSGSVDEYLVNINAKTTNLPSDPADQSAVESAITVSQGVITGAISGLNDLSSSEAQAAAEAALAAYDAATAADMSGVPAAVDVELSAAHGSGAWDGVATPLTAQQTRDAMKLAPSPGAPGSGSVDEYLFDIDVKTANLPDDPADESLIEAAISGLHDLSIADVQSAMTAQGYTSGRAVLIDNLDKAISTLHDIDVVGVQSALTNQGYTTGRAPLLDNLDKAISILHDVDITDIQTALTNQGLTTGRAVLMDNLSALDGTVSSVIAAIGALNDLSTLDVQNAMTTQGYNTARAALLDYLDALVSNVPAAVDVVLTAAHGSGSWEALGTPSGLADAIWNEPIDHHVGSGTFGEEIQLKTEPGDEMALTATAIQDIRIEIMNYVVNANPLGLTFEQTTNLVRQLLNNRLELSDGGTGNWVLYDDTDAAVLLTYNVRDKSNGNITIGLGIPARRTRGA